MLTLPPASPSACPPLEVILKAAAKTKKAELTQIPAAYASGGEGFANRSRGYKVEKNGGGWIN